MRLKDLAAGVSDLFKFDPRILQIDPTFNVRRDTPELRQHIDELKGSIREHGVKKPLKVRLDGERVFIVDGHTRLRAVMELIEDGAEIETVPCVPEARFVSEADRTLDLLTENSGKPLEPLEKGEVFKRLLAFGWDEARIALKSGLGVKQVQNLLALSAAPEAVKEMVSNGEVSATTALRAVQAEGGAQATETLKEAVAEAKANGKGKATPKAVAAAAATRQANKAAVAAPKADDEQEPPPAFTRNQVGAGLIRPSAPAPASTPAPAPRVIQMPVSTPAKFRQLVETLHACLDTTDVKMIHALIRDALGSKKG